MGSSTVIAIILGFLLALALNALLAQRASIAAEQKGHSRGTWFHLCFWLGPIAYLIVAALPDLKVQDYLLQIAKQQEKLLDALKFGEVTPANPASAPADAFQLPPL